MRKCFASFPNLVDVELYMRRSNDILPILSKFGEKIVRLNLLRNSLALKAVSELEFACPVLQDLDLVLNIAKKEEDTWLDFVSVEVMDIAKASIGAMFGGDCDEFYELAYGRVKCKPCK